MAQLARVHGGLVGGGVSDQTGLTGTFDFTLNWAPDTQPGANGPSLFTAIQEQLGLKLEVRPVQIEVLVIDSIEPPTDNERGGLRTPRESNQGCVTGRTARSPRPWEVHSACAARPTAASTFRMSR